MKQASEIQVEDMITVLMRRDDPDIERIGIHESDTGWQCNWVWLMSDVPRVTKKERNEILARANLILSDLQKDFAILKTKLPPPQRQTFEA